MSSFTFYNDQTLNNLNANQLNSTALVVDSLVVNNNSIINGDLAINGGDLVSTAAVAFNLLVNATLAPPAGAGPGVINLGGVGATTTIAGNLVVNGTITPAGGGLNRVDNTTFAAVGGTIDQLTLAESGTMFLINGTGNNVVTMPALSTANVGVNFEFLLTTAVGAGTTTTFVLPGTGNNDWNANIYFVGGAGVCTITQDVAGTTITWVNATVATAYLRVMCLTDNGTDSTWYGSTTATPIATVTG